MTDPDDSYFQLGLQAEKTSKENEKQNTMTSYKNMILQMQKWDGSLSGKEGKRYALA